MGIFINGKERNHFYWHGEKWSESLLHTKVSAKLQTKIYDAAGFFTGYLSDLNSTGSAQELEVLGVSILPNTEETLIYTNVTYSYFDMDGDIVDGTGGYLKLSDITILQNGGVIHKLKNLLAHHFEREGVVTCLSM